jgi:hypothetical protein
MKDRSRRRWMLRCVAALLAAMSCVVVLACNSPFIPIPPPDPSFAEGPTPGEWTVSTPPDSRAIGARFYIYNATLGSGLIQQAAPDGSMSAFPLPGQAGDRIHLNWERSITDSSATICRTLGSGLAVRACQ